MLTWLDRLEVFAEWAATVVTRSTVDMAAENLALRYQQPQLDDMDRLFWVILYRVSDAVERVLRVVKPATVVKWHKDAARFVWAQKSKKEGPGRPPVDPDIRDLVRKMATENPWGAPRIHAELLKLGYAVSERTVSKYMPKRRKPPSQTWRTFLNNHIGCLVCVDFFTVMTAFFETLYVFVILDLDRRRVVGYGVTKHPTAEWTANIVVDTFPWDTAPRYLLRDRDAIYGAHFRTRIKGMGIKEVLTAPQSPWQNPYAERVIGSVRRELLDHVIVFGEGHLKRLLKDYFAYYHDDRTHLSLDKDAPNHRPAQAVLDGDGTIVALPRLGGLHHRYEWREAA